MPADNPTGVALVGPGTPYITPALLTSASTGISWDTIPGLNSTPEAQLAEQLNICARATAMVDEFCNQPLRATVDTETLHGPGDFRCQLQPTGVARLLLSRSPITSVVSGQVTATAAFPPSWSTIPANQFRVERPLLGVYGTTAPGAAGGGGQSLLLAPGWVTWLFGRVAYEVQVTYLNGWPHASLSTPAAAGATSLVVDDVTGWAGAGGTIHDGDKQEFVAVTTVTPTTTGAISGPGTLTLSAGLTFGHDRGVLVSTLPDTVQQATILYATVQALTRGATATAVQTLGSSTGTGGLSANPLVTQAQSLLHGYRRVI